MIDRRWTQLARRTAVGGVLSLVVLTAFAQGAARAQEDEANSIWNLDKRLMDGFAKGLGLKSPTDSPVEYRERSPLVLPPSRNLPPPEVEGAGRTAAWPVDPDQQRRKAAATKKKTGVSRADDDDYQMRTLSPSEVNGSGPATGSPGRGNTGSGAGSNETPSQLGYFGGLFSWNSLWGGQKEEYGTFTREPARDSLVAPPVGYQTPSAAQPYGVSKEKVRQRVTPLDPAVGDAGK